MNCMIAFQTSRSNLPSFLGENLADLWTLMTTADFMRFSLDVFSREQTTGFLEKIRGRDREELPSQFTLISRSDQKLIGYCGFFLQAVDDVEELETVFRGSPTVVFGINREQRNGA
jgi:hypothetical protein